MVYGPIDGLEKAETVTVVSRAYRTWNEMTRAVQMSICNGLR